MAIRNNGEFGDISHLFQFRTNPESYQKLLNAVRHTVEKRQILPPFLTGDLFGRHYYLGKNRDGEVRERDLPDEKPALQAALEQSPWDYATEETIVRKLKDFFLCAVEHGDMIIEPVQTKHGICEGFCLVTGGPVDNSGVGLVFGAKPNTRKQKPKLVEAPPSGHT